MVKNRKLNIMVRLLLIAIIPLMLCCIVLVVGGSMSINEGLKTKAEDSMKYLASAVRGSYYNMEGDFEIRDNELYKGEYNLTKNSDDMDTFVNELDADVTICYEDVRMATTLDKINGEDAIGTKISEEVWNTIKQNKNYITTDIIINGKDYVAVYLPVVNSKGNVIGSVFAGEPLDEVNCFILKKIMTFIIAAILGLVVAIVVVIFTAKRISSAIKRAELNLKSLEKGNLKVETEENEINRTDEIGDMYRAVNVLSNKLNEIIIKLKDTANQLNTSGKEIGDISDQSSKAAAEISAAIEDISKGAVSQSEDVQKASLELIELGKAIDEITTKVKKLVEISDDMMRSSSNSSKTMTDLTKSNELTTEAIRKIGIQLENTNEAISKISGATELITNIASQTNLLSLNASIESARAGEAGRGFAVVASEIQTLSAQSDETAKEIQSIINELQGEASKTLKIMEEVNILVEEQIKKLNQTKESFDSLNNKIEDSKSQTMVIKNNTVDCSNAKILLDGVISNLSAISQQNAASTEETTASMQELDATINVMAATSKDLAVLSEELKDQISFFK